MDLEGLMRLAIVEAKKNPRDVPVGALIVDEAGKMLSRGFNRREQTKDPTSHAEIEALRGAAAATGDWRLGGMTLVVTLEPCLMCAGAVRQSRLSRVVFGAWELTAGAAGSRLDVFRDATLGKPIEVIGGVLEKECSRLVAEYFKELRN
jgi:tRNA(adenine34) deaminase